MSKKETIFGISISLVSLIIIGLTFISYNLSKLINLRYFTNSDEYIFHTDKLGHFGDFIGGFLGTILTGIATYFVYKTYISQKEELEKQKEELILNRQLIAQQQFESTFFNMLNVHRELKSGLYYSEVIITSNPYKNEYDGLEVVKYINKSFREKYSKLKNNKQNPLGTVQDNIVKQLQLNLSNYNEINEENILRVVFNYLFKTHQNQISHYCRNVYHILKYIRENEKNKTLGEDFNKYKSYVNIFQSQLNVDEQFLLFYNFIHFNDESKGIYSTINLVNHYQFLENLGHENLLHNEKHNNKNFYNFDIK